MILVTLNDHHNLVSKGNLLVNPGPHEARAVLDDDGVRTADQLLNSMGETLVLQTPCWKLQAQYERVDGQYAGLLMVLWLILQASIQRQ